MRRKTDELDKSFFRRAIFCPEETYLSECFYPDKISMRTDEFSWCENCEKKDNCDLLEQTIAETKVFFNWFILSDNFRDWERIDPNMQN